MGCLFLIWHRNLGWEVLLRLLAEDVPLWSRRHILLGLAGSLHMARDCKDAQGHYGGIYLLLKTSDVDFKAVEDLCVHTNLVADNVQACTTISSSSSSTTSPSYDPDGALSPMASLKAKCDERQIDGYVGMSRYLPRRGDARLIDTNEPVNSRVAAMRTEAGGASNLSMCAVAILPDLDEHITAIGLHIVEHFLNIAGDFTVADRGGKNVNVVDSSVFATLVPAREHRRFLRVVDYIYANWPDEEDHALPYIRDKEAWSYCFSPLFPGGMPISGYYATLLFKGSAREHEYRALCRKNAIPDLDKAAANAAVGKGKTNHLIRPMSMPYLRQNYKIRERMTRRNPNNALSYSARFRDKVQEAVDTLSTALGSDW